MIEQITKNKYSNWRIYFLIIAFGAGFLAVVVRLAGIQIKDSWRYKDMAKRQYESKISLSPERGNIYDRNMNTLVSNTIYFSFGADPAVIQSTNHVVDVFASLFNKPKSYYKEKLEKETRFIWLERMVPENIARQIDNNKIKGLVKIEEPRRLYLNNEICGQVIGCTNIDNMGMSGVESQFEKILHGNDGFMVLQRNGLGKVNPSLDLPRQNPENGEDIVLTIDLVYQTIVEEELVKGSTECGAEAGMAIMLEPSTGAVLALANYPSVDPNKFNSATPAQSRNRVVSDMFEPGSTFKLVTIAAALEEGVVKPDDKYYCENGKYKMGNGIVIEDAHPFGLLTFTEAVQQSSNIFMSKIVKLIGDEKFYKYARNFGFGISTGIELPGEMRGELHKPVEWSQETLTYMSFGYQLSATVLQTASAYSAIANKGILMKPHIIQKILRDDNSIAYQAEPQEIRRVVSEKTAQEMTKMFRLAVQKGTGKEANIAGVDIAGKTGTAQKIIDGNYSKQRHCASFIGYLPAENPRFVLMILMDSPQKGSYGGEVSAPIFRKIISRIMNFENLRENEDAKKKEETSKTLITKVPNVNQQKFENAQKLLEHAGYITEKVGNGNKVIKQFPEANSSLAPGKSVKLFTVVDSSNLAYSSNTMPSVVGLSLREAVNKLSPNYLNVSVSGKGIVRSQDPLPGEKTKRGMKCKLMCEPVNERFASSK
jgi:cell division protein FtsI/penicillin-binding protein 2